MGQKSRRKGEVTIYNGAKVTEEITTVEYSEIYSLHQKKLRKSL